MFASSDRGDAPPSQRLQMDLPLRNAEYIRTSVCSTVVEGDCVCIMGAWDMRNKASEAAKTRVRVRARTQSLA